MHRAGLPSHLDTDQAAMARMEQRLDTLHTARTEFPLQVWLLTEGNETPAQVLNISGNSIGLPLEPDALPADDDAVKVHLRFGAHQQLVDGHVTHLRPEAAKAYFGVGLKFSGGRSGRCAGLSLALRDLTSARDYQA